jgi:nucleoside-diphosphate-sugar epimerase
VHEADVAEAIVRALHATTGGAINVAHPRTFSWRSVVRAHAPRAVGLPLGTLSLGLRVACRVAGWGGESAWIAGATQSLTVDCGRASRELGWAAAHDPLPAMAGR